MSHWILEEVTWPSKDKQLPPRKISCMDDCGFGVYWTPTQSNFTCEQVQDYCQRYREWYELCDKLKLSIDYTHVLFGIVGIVGYSILIYLYQARTFGAVSFVYHRAINYMELVHMVVMIQSGICMSQGYPDSYYFILYRTIWGELWVLGDAMKLSVAMLTTVTSFERAAAIWSDSTFKRINRNGVARVFVILSLMPGILHFSPLLSAYAVPASPNSTLYVMVEIPFGQQINSICWEIIYVLKLTTSVIIAVFSVAVVIGLVLKSRKVSKLNESRQEKWRQSKMLCLLQLVSAFTCLFDHVVWVTSKLIKYETHYYTGVDAIQRLTYDNAIWTLDRRLRYHITWVMESLCGEIDHSMRLFVYLICLKSIRNAFTSLISCKTSVRPVSGVTSNFCSG